MSTPIRLAKLEDAKFIREIYRPSIEQSAVSFELEVPTVEEMQRRISVCLEKYPWLVFEDAGNIIGYAYAGSFRSRWAYQWSVETSVYVDPNHRGQRVGKRLYEVLIEELRQSGAVNLIAGVTLPNDASVRFHESMGFKKVAQFQDVGYKFSQWWDVGFWQRQLGRPAEPKPMFEVR